MLIALWYNKWTLVGLKSHLHGQCGRVGRAAEKLEDATFEMQLVATVVEATSQPMPRRDPLRPAHGHHLPRGARPQAPLQASLMGCPFLCFWLQAVPQSHPAYSG